MRATGARGRTTVHACRSAPSPPPPPVVASSAATRDSSPAGPSRGALGHAPPGTARCVARGPAPAPDGGGCSAPLRPSVCEAPLSPSEGGLKRGALPNVTCGARRCVLACAAASVVSRCAERARCGCHCVRCVRSPPSSGLERVATGPFPRPPASPAEPREGLLVGLEEVEELTSSSSQLSLARLWAMPRPDAGTAHAHLLPRCGPGAAAVGRLAPELTASSSEEEEDDNDDDEDGGGDRAALLWGSEAPGPSARGTVCSIRGSALLVGAAASCGASAERVGAASAGPPGCAPLDRGAAARRRRLLAGLPATGSSRGRPPPKLCCGPRLRVCLNARRTSARF